MTNVVKVQRAIFGPKHNAAGQEMILVYDEKRVHRQEQPLTRDVEKLFAGDIKMYCEANWSSIVGWGIHKRIGEQSW